MERIFAIYSRKSRFTGKGESVENQVELCRQYLFLNFGSKAAETANVYEDEGFSGGNLERPQFQKMMEDAKTQGFAAVVVYRLDRISRNIGDFAGLIQRLEAMEIGFISIKEQFDTSSPMGRAMMFISSVFSQLERETIAERIRDNMQELAKTGRWLGGVTPTGYESEPFDFPSRDGKTKKACRLKEVPGEAAAVRLIFHKFIETGSIDQTEDFLNQHGFQTKTGRQFSRFAVKGILSNPVYMAADQDAFQFFLSEGAEIFPGREAFCGENGVMVYNRSRQQPGKAHKIRPIEEWIVAVGGHKGLVDGKTWLQARKLLERNRCPLYKKPRNPQALLPGRLFCQNCGNPMRPKLSGRPDKEGARPCTYLCTLKEKSRRKDCSMKNVGGKQAEEAVLSALAGLETDRGEYLRELEKGRKRLLRRIEKEIPDVRRQKRELEGQIERLISAMKENPFAAAEKRILEELEVLCQKKAQIEAQIQEEKREEAIQEGHPGCSLALSQAAEEICRFSSFYGLLVKLTAEEKREIIRSLTDKVTWDGETLHIFLAGSAGEVQK